MFRLIEIVQYKLRLNMRMCVENSWAKLRVWMEGRKIRKRKTAVILLTIFFKHVNENSVSDCLSVFKWCSQYLNTKYQLAHQSIKIQHTFLLIINLIQRLQINAICNSIIRIKHLYAFTLYDKQCRVQDLKNTLKI